MPASIPMKIRMTRLVCLSRCRKVGAGRVMTSFAALEWDRTRYRVRKGANYAVCDGEMRGYPSIERPASVLAGIGAQSGRLHADRY
ncbi:hypothetical protein H681_09475 [Pseudomonas sp. ATCC 13867]|nr:hypothetical protein H681_09475 [Pseudomonas sp. ATCC 13867]